MITKATAGSILYSLHFDRDSLTLSEREIDGKIYTLPMYGQLQNSGIVGNPSLPCEYISFALPVYADSIKLKDVALESKIELKVPFPLLPQQPDIVSNNYTESIVPESTTKTPSSEVSIYHIENYKEKVKIVTVEVRPVSYYEKITSIILSQAITFTIDYTEPEHVASISNSSMDMATLNNVIQNDDEDITFIKRLVVNPDAITNIHDNGSYQISAALLNPNERDKPLPAYEYTIITSRELEKYFDRFVALKKMQGFNTGVVCIEDILANSSYFKNKNITESDSAAILRSYFLYNKAKINTILLGGKPPIVPMRFGYRSYKNEYESNIPTDLYFGSPEDVDWNKSNDGVYGKNYSGFSYSSLFSIGRLLCSTPEDVINFTDKVEIYEQNPGLGDHSYLSNAYTHASSEACGWRDNYHNISYGEILNNSLEKLFGQHYVSDRSNDSHTGKFVLNEMKDSHYAFYDIYGHGNPEGITTIDRGNDYTPNGINALDGEYVYLSNEMNNGIDNLDNFGYPAVFFWHIVYNGTFRQS